jgi:hypothetical protein
MTKVRVNPGVCGLSTEITATSEDGQMADIDIQTDCPHIKAFGEALQSVDGYAECFGKMCDSAIYQAAQQHCKHPACPVPCAVLKGVEAACGLALPRDVEIKIENQ